MNSLVPIAHGFKKIAKTVLARRYKREIASAYDLDEKALRRCQHNDLNFLIKYSRENIPYYMRTLKGCGDVPEDMDSLYPYLRSLPIISKETLRTQSNDLIRQRIPGYVKYSATSGTTGTPLRTAMSIWELVFYYANLDEWYYRISGKTNPRVLRLTGMLTPDRKHDTYSVNRLNGDTYISSYSLKRENRAEYVSLIRRFKPEMIYGYPSSLYQLAEILGDEMSVEKDERIAVVTSEVLKPQWRELIENNLCSRVYNLYGSQELSHLVMECPYGRMHVNPLIGIVEVVDDNGDAVEESNAGRVVVTSLYKRIMPLIRYDLGDLVTYTFHGYDCPCGLSWSTIGKIEGRSGDLVKTRDGRLITLLDYYVLKDIAGIRQGQIIQTYYDCFIFKLIRDEQSTISIMEIEENITSRLARILAINPVIHFEYMDAIPRGPGGKFRPVIVHF